MRLVLSLFLMMGAIWAQDRQALVACMVTSRDWVVGANLPPSGLMVRTPAGWELRGYPHPIMNAVASDASEPAALLLAAGSGVIRATGGGRKWRIQTGHEITELRDITTDRKAPGVIYAAHTWGLAVSRDRGATWADATGDRPTRYTESVRADGGLVVTGTEDGLWRSEDGGAHWTLAGARGWHILHVEQSPHDASDWMAVTSKGGVFRSRDGARTFENVQHLGIGRNLGVDRNLYDIAYDPAQPGRMAVAGFGPGVMVSEDDGKTWTARNLGLPKADVWSVTFDPEHAGRLYASVHEEALYVSQDAGRTWSRDGLEGSAIYRLKFVPREAVR
jgi:hypothetical protein